MTRLPIVLSMLAALAVPTLGVTAPGDGALLERMQERRGARAERFERNEQRFLDGLSVRDPERHSKVVEIRTQRPIMYRQLLRNAGQELRLRNTDPESWSRLERLIDRTYELKTHLDAWEQADDKGRDKLRPRIEKDVGELFELRQEQRRAQLAAMEARLERLRTEISARDAQKDEVVGEFTDRMLRLMERGGR